MSILSIDLKELAKSKKYILKFLHIIVLLLSLFLVFSISIDTFRNIAFYKAPHFLRIQFWICIVFIADFFIEWVLSENKKSYFISRIFFLLVSIPYLPIIDYFGWKFSPQLTYILQFIPLVRGGYALAIVVGWFTSNRATGLFFTYIITLFSSVYFASLAFYVFEHNINPLVPGYIDALWWALMDVTTVGSNIIAVTPVGRVLSVILAALGMMMFPIFTVYVTSLIKNKTGHENDKPTSDVASSGTSQQTSNVTENSAGNQT